MIVEHFCILLYKHFYKFCALCSTHGTYAVCYLGRTLVAHAHVFALRRHPRPLVCQAHDTLGRVVRDFLFFCGSGSGGGGGRSDAAGRNAGSEIIPRSP
jgi:hypothetical protein